jgi:hypothetical protein
MSYLPANATVGWAKAPLRRAQRRNCLVGTPTGAHWRDRWLCPPYGSRYFSPTLNGASLPGGVDSSAIASIIAIET